MLNEKRRKIVKKEEEVKQSWMNQLQILAVQEIAW
jgi:hypothetical protein